MKNVLILALGAILLTSVSALSCEGPLPCGLEASDLTSEDWQDLFDEKPSIEALLELCNEIFYSLYRPDMWDNPEVRRQQVTTMQQAYKTIIDLINKEARTKGREVRDHIERIEYYTDLKDKVMQVDLYDVSLKPLYETENKTEAGQ